MEEFNLEPEMRCQGMCSGSCSCPTGYCKCSTSCRLDYQTNEDGTKVDYELPDVEYFSKVA